MWEGDELRPVGSNRAISETLRKIYQIKIFLFRDEDERSVKAGGLNEVGSNLYS